MGLQFPNNYDITEALDETCLGAIRFSALEEPDRVFDSETKDYTGEIKAQKVQLIFGNPGEPKIARRVKFPSGVDLTGFKRRDSVQLIDPEYHVMYIPAQDGNREYADLVIYAKGLEKVSPIGTSSPQATLTPKGTEQKVAGASVKEKPTK